MLNVLEHLGRKEVALAEAIVAISEANSQYLNLWMVLKNVSEGHIKPEQVQVWQDESGNYAWKINAASPSQESSPGPESITEHEAKPPE